ncbi:kinesin-like protein KIN-14L [Rutidosis leptorrhynchoides]|uniref:kinesin-like protein KIN-14L n=1 Tax=Rutidosis leptorrhynchoides TaxID=125765 RepID=UPI003A98E28A
MEVIASREVNDLNLNLASRKAQEAAWRRFQATEWLESIVGPLQIPKQPSEKEFISCLRNGLILCDLINKIEPGSVPKVVKISKIPSQELTWDSQPLPAYQFFENVRNFLKAVEELKLPVFEASVFGRDNLEKGSSTKIVDCILGLKEYNERKLRKDGNGSCKHSLISPLRSNGRTPMWLDPNRQLGMSANTEKQSPSQNDAQKLEDSIVNALADCMIDAKENFNSDMLSSLRNGNTDSLKLFSKMLLTTLEEQSGYKFPKSNPVVKHLSKESSGSILSSAILSPPNSSTTGNGKRYQAVDSNHEQIVVAQEKKLQNLKALLSITQAEFGDMQSQLQKDFKEIESHIMELSAAAQGYHKVLRENRTLYNMVQDLKGNIRVYCRIRPAFKTDTKNVIDYIGEDGSLVVMDPTKPHKDGKKLFQFNHVFGPTATQEEVFKDTQPLIRSVMDGYNVCIFAYGQTGSGKTHTMCGPSGASKKDLGINYLALNDLFDLSNTRKDVINYELYVQMVEIYNEQVRDLLTNDSASNNKLEIRSCAAENGLSLPDATIVPVMSITDVLNLMKSGQVNRAVSSTALNNQSSRSHSILTVHVHGKDINGGMIRSCLHLVDLAGSERVDKSEVTGDGLKEAQYINKSLSCLGDVITALSQKNSYIPYRNSKLTLLLQNSLGGNAKTLMFAHVSPESDSLGETVSTLKFAQRASTVELGAASLNKESREVMDLKEQIETLKRQLGEKEPNSAQQVNRLEPKSPLQRQKTSAAVVERTPPRPRRLSIENKCGPPPKSPMGLNSAAKSRQMKTDVRLPKTPEPQVSIRKEIVISSEIRTSTVNGNVRQSEMKSSSHIKKSLRTIGKLINGSEKRIQQKTNEVQSLTPLTVSKPSRRQSLTGVQPLSKPCVDGNRNAKTPPPANRASNGKWM